MAESTAPETTAAPATAPAPTAPAAAPTATTTAATPTVKVEVATTPTPRSPAQDAKDALAARKELDQAQAIVNKKLADEGKLVEPTAIVSYESSRAQLGKPVADAVSDASKANSK